MKFFRFLSLAFVALAVLVALPSLLQAMGPAHAASPGFSPLLLAPFLMGSMNDTTAQDKSSNFSLDTVRVQVNKAIADLQYFLLNRPAWQVAAAAVAPPVLATATVTTQVKSTATTQLILNGVLISLSATDPLLLAADIAAGDPNQLAIGSVRKWQVCWDGTNATTKITCRPSNDQVIGAGTAAAALAKCRWPSLPPAGTVIVGVVHITNVTNLFTPGTTLLGAAGVTAAYIDGPTTDCFLSTPVTP